MLRFPTQNTDGLFGDVFYIHNEAMNHRSAFESKEKIAVCARIPTKLGARELTLILYSESGAFLGKYIGKWVNRRQNQEYYQFDMTNVTIGLYFFSISARAFEKELFANRSDYSRFTFSDFESSNRFQLSVSDFQYEAPSLIYGGVMYEIFVDRFSRGGGILKKEGAIYPEDFALIPEYPEYPGAPMKNNTFYGGNISGIIEKLDYFCDLGVNVLYLTPIFESVSNHKYDTADYMKIDSGFGSEKKLTELISKAREYGISVILDGVFNHTGDDSLYFNKYRRYDSVGAYNSKSSKFYGWYEFKSYPHSYTSWWDIDILPRVNPKSHSFWEFIAGGGGVVDKYTSLGILGFRLDVADELDDEFIELIKARQNTNNKRSVLYGEVWEDGSNKSAYGKRKKYYLGKELDGVMNYPIRTGIIEFIMHRGCEALKYALCEIYNNAPKRIADLQMNLLGTHDTPRILTVLSDGYSPNRSNAQLRCERISANERHLAKERLLCAYTILSTVPGIPMIYYGDEVGVEGYSDPFNRLPYPHGSEDEYILEGFRLIGNIRRRHSVYKEGSFKLLHVDDDTLVFARYTNSRAYITAANISDYRVTIKFTSKAENILDGSCGMMYNLYKNQAAVYKVKRTAEIDFKKE